MIHAGFILVGRFQFQGLLPGPKIVFKGSWSKVRAPLKGKYILLTDPLNGENYVKILSKQYHQLHRTFLGLAHSQVFSSAGIVNLKFLDFQGCSRMVRTLIILYVNKR